MAEIDLGLVVGPHFTPSVDREGTLSWTNDGELENPAPVNIKGESAHINGVNALTIEAGENITATQSGDTLRISATDTVYDTATASSAGLMSAADKAKLDGIASGAEVNVLESVSVNGNAVSVTNKTAALTLDKSTVGLGNVDNTSDVHKPVSTAQQAALDLKVNISAVGAANGVAELDSAGKVLSSQLPSYVDDVLEYAAVADFPATGESGKIYVATSTNLTYRWTGTGYAEISPSIALGETSATAYRGDRGKIAYDHSQATGNAHSMTKADIGLGNVDNTSDANKPISTAQQTALDLKVDKVTGKQLSTNDYTTAEKQKLEGIESEAQVNEVSAEQYAKVLGQLSLVSREYASLRTTLNNLIAGLDMPLLVMSMSGEKGYLLIEDAASGSVFTLTVDPALSGTTLYIQVRDLSTNTMQSITATVSGSGNVPVTNANSALLHVAYGRNQVFVAKTAYVWAGTRSTTIGRDGYPVNGVDFTITYSRDKTLGAEVDKGYLIWDDVLEICGYNVTRTAYESTAAAIAGFNRGETVVVKVTPRPDSLRRLEYTNPISAAPSPTSTVTYYHETCSLREA